MTDLEGWTPMRVYWQQARPMVDWGYLGKRRFTDPFFEQTIASCVRHPADLLFRHQTPLEYLGEFAENRPGLAPTGFIFHMSRCGSTLISQMLAAVAKNIVISEASPVDAILRAHLQDANATEERRIKWLRWMLSALGRQRWPEEKYFFIKFDCWHTLFLPMIQRAFPGVPWIFIYREPVEVLMSHAKQRGAQMIPGVLDPRIFGWDSHSLERMHMDEYGARVLAKICEAAREQAEAGKLVNYRQLPDIVWRALMKHWRMDLLPAEAEQVSAASRLNAKNPVLPFENDAKAKNEQAPEEIRRVARQWLDGVYQQLERQRLAVGFADGG